MSKNSDFIQYAQTLHGLFDENFMTAYRKANPRRRRRLLPYMQSIYRRWYFATLAEHTPFAPANLMEGICRIFKINMNTYPIPMLRTSAKVTGIDFALFTCSLDLHPAAGDMRILLNLATPHLDVSEDACFTDEQALDIAEHLSINDPHYASFLLELAIRMKLLTKAPSIHIFRMQPTDKGEEIFEWDDRSLFREITETAIIMTAGALRNSMPVSEHLFTPGFVRSMLTEPIETDTLFSKIFEASGYDINDILQTGAMPLPGEDEIDEYDDADLELISSTYVMGIVLDRFFFTPFGHYLRLIRPMYTLPFDINEEIEDYISVCEDPHEAFVAFFAPCSSYTLTWLGLLYFEVEPMSGNFFDTFDSSFVNLVKTMLESDSSFRAFVDIAQYFTPPYAEEGIMLNEVYTFRVRDTDRPSMWIHLQMPTGTTLCDVYTEAEKYFDMAPGDDFTFFHDKTENHFAEYPSAKRAARAKKPRKDACQTGLRDLDFVSMNQMLLVSHNSRPPVRLNLELMRTDPADLDERHPRVIRMSKEMKLRHAEE